MILVTSKTLRMLTYTSPPFRVDRSTRQEHIIQETFYYGETIYHLYLRKGIKALLRYLSWKILGSYLMKFGLVGLELERVMMMLK